jgi:hypothetical protein
VRDRRRRRGEPFNPFAANANEVRRRKAKESLHSQGSDRNDNSHSQSSRPDFDKSDFDKSSPASENEFRDLLARKKNEHSAIVEQETVRKEQERERELREEQERQLLLRQKIEPYKAELMSDIMDKISKIQPLKLTQGGKIKIKTGAFRRERDPGEFLVYVREKGLIRSEDFFRMSSALEDFDTRYPDHLLLFKSNGPRSAKEFFFQIPNGMLLMTEGAFAVQSVNFDDFSSSEFLRSESEIMDIDYCNETGMLAVATRDRGNVLFNSKNGDSRRLPHDGKRSSMTFFSPDGTYVAFASERSPEISIYEVNTRKKLHDVYTGYGVISARFSEDSEVVLATFSAGKMIVIEIETGAIIDEFDFDTDEYDHVEWAREGMNVYGTNVYIGDDGQFIQNNRTQCGRFILRETEVIDTVGTKSIDFRNWFPIVPVPLYPEHLYLGKDTEIFTATLKTVNNELSVHGFSLFAFDSKNFEIQWKSGVI